MTTYQRGDTARIPHDGELIHADVVNVFRRQGVDKVTVAYRRARRKREHGPAVLLVRETWAVSDLDFYAAQFAAACCPGCTCGGNSGAPCGACQHNHH